VPNPGIPESFKVLIKELQSLCLDVRVLDQNGDEIDFKQNFDDDNMGLAIKEDDLFDNVSVEVESEIADGFEVEHPDLDGFDDDLDSDDAEEEEGDDVDFDLDD
jgi:DNA-directed RNA polymerase subunit beta